MSGGVVKKRSIAEYSEFFSNKMLWDDPPSRLRRAA